MVDFNREFMKSTAPNSWQDAYHYEKKSGNNPEDAMPWVDEENKQARPNRRRTITEARGRRPPLGLDEIQEKRPRRYH